MTYRSKRTMSNALPNDASECPKRPMPTPMANSSKQSTIAATSSSKQTEKSKNFEVLKPPLKPILSKGSNDSPHMSFSSKPTHKWGPFGPPVDALNTSSSIPGSTPSSSNSIWKTTPAIATTKPSTSKPSAATPKPPSTTKPLAATTKPPTTTKPPITTKPPLATTKPPATTNSPCNNTYEDMQQTILNAQNTSRQTSEQQTSEQQTSGDFGNNRSDKPKPTKSRLPFSVNGWPTDVVYDAKEEVATIGAVPIPQVPKPPKTYANGKVELVSGPIQPIDVLSSNGRRYFVEFNELHQPLRKGGHILVKFLGYIAKMGNYCPLGALTWRNVEKKLKFDILKKMRQDAKAKVETLKLFAPSTSCKEDLEDEAFHDVMNGGKIPERPQGFGFGVKRSDVYGVRGLVRKEGYSKGKMKFVELDLNSNSSPCNKKKEDLEKRNEELSMKYNENNNLLKTVVTQFSEFLDVMRNGNTSVQLIDAAQSTLAMATQQVLILPLKFSRIMCICCFRSFCCLLVEFIEEKKSF
ncbi:Filamentous hemagglutinin [Bienertia sinuspersici]